MKVAITGGTGFIGSTLGKTLVERGDEVIVLSRKAHSSSNPKIRYVQWNPEDLSRVVTEVDGTDAVINLVGESIIGRWSRKKKEKILSSRVHATRIIANSIKEAAQRPKVLINASAVGFYGSRESEFLTEESSAGDNFLSEACKAWEAHAIRVEDYNVRVVRLRFGIVLDPSGGALKLMLLPFKLFLGGWLGSGNQWFSWIVREDLIRLIIFCLEHPEAKGAINATSPNPVTNKVFSLVLAQVLGRPCLVPVPAFALKILLGEGAKMLLTGQRVIPKKAGELGFTFRYPEIRHALEALLKGRNEG
ncbi:MAG: TIGR01777 family protein [Candidatus Omnitrophica bacterium]|nr:TIGR01777 family protein [Candidatus Omnitrophota bacterium]